MRELWIVLVSVLVASCARSETEPARPTSPAGKVAVSDDLLLKTRCVTARRDAAGNCLLWEPSLVELFARPEFYNGKRVRVIGFVNFEFEGNGLYFSREDWARGISRNGFWIDPPTRAVLPNQRYVIVEGRFSAEDTGHMGAFSGSIHDVTRLDAWEPVTDVHPSNGSPDTGSEAPR